MSLNHFMKCYKINNVTNTLEAFQTNFRVIDTAASQLTKTAITVTAIFIAALGYDMWYYILAYSGVTDYVVNTPLQKAGKNTLTTKNKSCRS